jgi:tRNA(Ile)-lysidine synthase
MLSPGDRVAVAVSGGADSVALLDCLLKLANEQQLQLFVVHVNHMLRGAEADGDANFVAQLAERHNLPFTICRLDVGCLAKTMTTSKQDAARILRYKALEEEAVNWGANKIALGHHADDQAETVLLHLLRGTGVEGLTGMQPVREHRYIRPLLAVTREEIEAYCGQNNLNYRTDRSNLEPIYLRNKIRLELMPLLQKEYNPALVLGLNRLANIAREESDFLNQETNKAYAQVATIPKPSEVNLAITQLAALPIALQRRVLIKAWKQVSRAHSNLELARVDEALDLVHHRPTGSSLQLPNGVCLEKCYGILIVRLDLGHNELEKEFAYTLPVPGKIVVAELGITIKAELLLNNPLDSTWSGNQSYSVLLDADKLNFPLEVRNRRPGDRFYPLGAPGHKKLKEFFIDAKVPREQRKQALLVCSNEQIVWVSGLRLAEPHKITQLTKRMLALTVEKP